MRAVDILVLLDRAGVDLCLRDGRILARRKIPPDLTELYKDLRSEIREILEARSVLPDDPELDVEAHGGRLSRYCLAEVEAGIRLMAAEERAIYEELLEDHLATIPGHPTYGHELAARLAYTITRSYWRHRNSEGETKP